MICECQRQARHRKEVAIPVSAFAETWEQFDLSLVEGLLSDGTSGSEHTVTDSHSSDDTGAKREGAITPPASLLEY